MSRALQVLVVLILGLSLIVGGCRSTTEVSPADFYKTKTVNMIVTAPPGDGTDLTCRVVAKYLQEQLGSKMPVDNKPGGGGTWRGLT